MITECHLRMQKVLYEYYLSNFTSILIILRTILVCTIYNHLFKRTESFDSEISPDKSG